MFVDEGPETEDYHTEIHMSYTPNRLDRKTWQDCLDVPSLCGKTKPFHLGTGGHNIGILDLV